MGDEKRCRGLRHKIDWTGLAGVGWLDMPGLDGMAGLVAAMSISKTMPSCKFWFFFSLPQPLGDDCCT